MSGRWWDEPTTSLIPGDPESVERLSANLGDTGDSISLQATRLRGVNADIWKGEAAVQFAKHIEETPGQLDLLATRYDGVAAALGTYASQLRGSQAKVTRAKNKAKEAYDAQVAAAAAVSDAESANASAQRAAESQTSPVDPPITPSLTDLGPLRRIAGDADGAMQEAELLRSAAEGDRDEAAGNCKQTIEGCIDDDLKDDPGWLKWVKKGFKAAGKILAVVGAVVGIAALFIPGLNLIALSIMATALFVDSMNYFVLDQGDLTSVLLDLVGVAAFASAFKAARVVRGAQKVTASANASRSAATGRSISRASSASRLRGIGRTQLGMSRAELRAAKGSQSVRALVGARQAENAARTGQALTTARSNLANARHPFRTMRADQGALFANPGGQLSLGAIRRQATMQLQIARSGLPGAAYGGSVAVGTGASVESARRELASEGRAEVDKAMAGVQAGATAPTAP